MDKSRGFQGQSGRHGSYWRHTHKGRTFITCLLNVGIVYVVILAGTECKGIHLVQRTPFLGRFLLHDADQHSRRMIADGLAITPIAIESPVLIDSSLFGPLHQSSMRGNPWPPQKPDYTVPGWHWRFCCGLPLRPPLDGRRGSSSETLFPCSSCSVLRST